MTKALSRLAQRSSRTHAPKTARARIPRDGAANQAKPRTGLDLLWGPMRGKFLAECWPGRPLVYHGSIDRLQRLTSLAALQSVPKLLSARAASYQNLTVFGGNGFARYMPPHEAIHFYQRGDNLSCSDLEATVPELRELLAELAAELHEPAEYFSCGVFAAGGGRGVTMHYDSVLTLNVQLQGEKVWRLAPNHHVENPIASSDNKADHAPRFAKRPFPRRMPRGAMTFRARPGSVVFIPRGYWHETDTFGESLALTFVLGLPTWGGRLLHQLRRKLEIHAAWRGYPMASAGDPEDRAALAAQLDALLPQLREIVGALDTEAILGAPLSDRCYRWPAGQQVAVVTRAKHHLLRATGHGRVREAAIEAPFVPVVAWLCAQRAVWSLEQARAACPSVPARYVDAMLAELAAQRFVVEA